MECEKYQSLKAREKLLQEDGRVLRNAIAAPDESIEDWVNEGVSESAYDELTEDKTAIDVAVAYERTQGVPDDDGHLAESLREVRRAQRKLWGEIQDHLKACPVCLGNVSPS